MQRNLRRDFLYWVAGMRMLPHRLRPALLRRAGVRIGERALILSGLQISNSDGILTLGDDVVIGYDVYFDSLGGITLEDHVGIGARTMLITSNHEIGDRTYRVGPLLPQPITIANGCWIGAGVTIMPGVSVGSGCIIGAGSLVLSDCADDGLYVGVPARRVRDLPK